MKFLKITWFEWFFVLITVCTTNLVQLGFSHVTDPNWTKTYEIGRKPTQFGVIRGQCFGPVKGPPLYINKNFSRRRRFSCRFFAWKKKVFLCKLWCMVSLVCGRESGFRLVLSRAHSLTFLDKAWYGHSFKMNKITIGSLIWKIRQIIWEEE